MSEEVKDIQTESTAASQTSSYRSIFKATSLFGGVQVYNILIGVLRSKIIAVLLGPLGVGIQGLYHSAIQLVQYCTSMGLSQSAVRDVSEANGTGDSYRVGRTVSIIKRLVWITGLLGFAVTILISPLLSKFSFGNYEYIIPFVFLAVVLLLDQLSAGQKVVLQGTRKLRYLATSSAIGVTIGLLFSIPFLWIWGTKGIVPALIVQSIGQLCVTSYYSRKVPTQEVHVSQKEALAGGKVMLTMGLAMSFSSILASLVAYVTRGFIRYSGGIEEVGYYTAGFAILSQYTGMIFSAMATDYYPRLAAVNKDNEKCKMLINQQGEIALLIMAPLLVLCILIMPLLIRILYSEDFLPANDYITWALWGMVFKAASWVFSYGFIAKGESKLYVVIEVISNLISLSFGILGYKFYGLRGMGLAFTLNYITYFFLVYIVANKKYSINLTREFGKVLFLQASFVLLAFLFINCLKSGVSHLTVAIMLVLSVSVSVKELNKKLQFKALISKSKKKFFRKKI